MMLDQNIETFESSKFVSGISFFDRGIPDLIHYAIRFNVDSAKFDEASQKYLYNRNVFIFSPWQEIFANDNERKMTFEKSIEFHELLIKTYQNLGYSLIQMPFDTVDIRVGFILDKIKEISTVG